jgi:hypothetical protein
MVCKIKHCPRIRTAAQPFYAPGLPEKKHYGFPNDPGSGFRTFNLLPDPFYCFFAMNYSFPFHAACA